jgi:hypothetical protein
MDNKPLKVSIPHRLTRQEAQTRLRNGIADFQKQYAGRFGQLDEKWAGDQMDFRLTAFGQAITGRIDVTDSAVNLEVDLPWVFAMLADKIRGQVQQAGTKLLEKK